MHSLQCSRGFAEPLGLSSFGRPLDWILSARGSGDSGGRGQLGVKVYRDCVQLFCCFGTVALQGSSDQSRSFQCSQQFNSGHHS